MKVRVYDSDGEFRGGLFKTDIYDAMTCRMWHAAPHPHFRESLVDIAGLDRPCYDSSWYLLRLSSTPDISGPPDGSDSFDANSQAIRISLLEALEWFRRTGFAPPEDLRALIGSNEARGTEAPPAAAVSSGSLPTGPDSDTSSALSASPSAAVANPSDPFAPYMPASWFEDEYGLHPERLRSAHRSGRVRANRQGKRFLYSVPGARGLWPELQIRIPEG